MDGSDLQKIPGLKLDGDAPVFNEPWEAQAFSIVVRLHDSGVFTWNEWAETLGQAIHADDGATPYYELWLSSLETIVSQKALITEQEVSQRKVEWQEALLATPHGEPVELEKNRTFNQ